MDKQAINTLELKIEELIQLCDVLNQENHVLKSRESNWARERAQLVENNELSRVKIEAMISRLKSLEQG